MAEGYSNSTSNSNLDAPELQLQQQLQQQPDEKADTVPDDTEPSTLDWIRNWDDYSFVGSVEEPTPCRDGEATDSQPIGNSGDPDALSATNSLLLPPPPNDDRDVLDITIANYENTIIISDDSDHENGTINTAAAAAATVSNPVNNTTTTTTTAAAANSFLEKIHDSTAGNLADRPVQQEGGDVTTPLQQQPNLPPPLLSKSLPLWSRMNSSL